MEYNKKNARFLSMLGHRGAFVEALMEVCNEGDNITVLTADMGDLTGLDRLEKKYPGHVLNVGIAEQNMIGMAAGMAKMGEMVFTTTYANFITMRSFEQIRMNLAYMKFNVKVIGTGGGISMGMSGNSHYGIEDIAIMRALPNMTVIAPADGIEIVKTVHAITQTDAPVYVRLTGNLNQKMIYTEDYDFQIGKAVTLQEGQDIAIIAHGTMVEHALTTAKLLEQEGISCSVVNMHTIKPIDTECIEKLNREMKMIVTMEEHSTIGGLGGAVAEHSVTLNNSIPQLHIGIPDTYCEIGTYDYLMEKYGLLPEQMKQKIIERYRNLCG